jgi:hypothetical protein
MTEDILEQLVDGWFKRKPSVFTKHNVKYRPDIEGMDKKVKNKYSVHSDINVLAVDLSDNTPKVSVVNCKSWQGGFDVELWYDKLSKVKNHIGKNGKQYWKPFRELTNGVWAKAFRDKILEETNSINFTYYIAVTRLDNADKIDAFKNCVFFLNKLKGDNKDAIVNIEFLTLESMITSIMEEKNNTAVESAEIGRFLQLIKAANMKISK